MLRDFTLLFASIATFLAVWFYLAADSQKDVVRKLFGACQFQDGLETFNQVRSDIRIAKGLAVVAMVLWVIYLVLRLY